MGFEEAVRSGFDHYTKFDGRARRSAYWYWFLFGILAAVVGAIIDGILGTGFIRLLITVGLFLPGLSVAIRRLHDTNHSGWWILIGIIPLIGFIVLLIFLVQDSDDGENDYGPNPKGAAAPAAA